MADTEAKEFKLLTGAFENSDFCNINGIKKKGLLALLKRRPTGYTI